MLHIQGMLAIPLFSIEDYFGADDIDSCKVTFNIDIC